MARQQVIAGTERTDVPKAVLDLAQEWLEVKRELRRMREKLNEKHIATVTLMEANKTKPFKLLDEESGEYHLIGTNTTTKLTAKKCAGDEVDERPDPAASAASGPTVHPGLIEQAASNMDAMNVEEDEEGDVVVPEKPAAKRNAKKGKKAKADGATETKLTVINGGELASDDDPRPPFLREKHEAREQAASSSTEAE